jgi:hypothetical protein
VLKHSAAKKCFARSTRTSVHVRSLVPTVLPPATTFSVMTLVSPSVGGRVVSTGVSATVFVVIVKTCFF